ncbi:MAG: type II toxin-antitoxin system HicB family antitoxin [Oculatellaceae cyanobacterium bins.114]|nr:type II toxin-antitoxin system HicB family antitoxin [Oculatellaceae cyanobacterium bins.114]
MKNKEKIKYSVLIQWSDEDDCFVVTLPEFTDLMQPCTHGETYEESIQNAQEVLELLVDSALEKGETLPKPLTFGKPLQAA